ncbi:MAG: hypothetical protein A3F68_04365 [Acidobacteria bacterium RIFCSPLOWO2_12_FULL_54_10]|nr:MAG: hypothetical protein A3F68_04365 [Acidobacteria bacterium RIFCSPLOWO2_12_FULL_54_10]
MELVRQEYFVLLWVVPILGILWWLGVWHQSRMRKRFGNLKNLKKISRISWAGRGWLRGLAFLVSLSIMVLALAQPRMVIRELKPVPTPTDLIFLLDISPSMYGSDMDPHRLGHAQEIIQQFLLHKQPQDRYGLVVFHYTSVVLSYLTRDPQSIIVYFDYLNQLEEPQPGSNMGSALRSALRVMELDSIAHPDLVKQRRRVFVLISDGNDNIGEWEEPLAQTFQQGVKIYTFGLGTASGAHVPLLLTQGKPVKFLTREGGARIVSKAQSRTLRDVAERTAGKFYRGEDKKQVNEALQEILVQGRPVAGYESHATRRELYQEFLLAAFAFLILGIFL